MNENQTHPTESDESRPIAEGLTPQQERAALLLGSGKGVQAVADELGVHRSTVWEWRRLETFQAFHNRIVGEIRQQARDGVITQRDKVLSQAYERHPERFVHNIPTAQRLPLAVRINKPMGHNDHGNPTVYGPESTVN